MEQAVPTPSPEPEQPTSPPSRRRGSVFWIGVMGVGFFAACTFGLLLLVVLVVVARSISPDAVASETASPTYFEISVEGSGPHKVVMIPIQGFISDRPVQEMFHKEPGLVQTVTHQLDRAASDDAVEAIILEIDSPGGQITATDNLHNEILGFKKKTGKKVIAYMKDLAASGGYYAAAPADKIIANPTTLTGSIGVIFMLFNMEGLLKLVGVKENVMKSGAHKDMGSAMRPMTEEERTLFQDIITEMYDRFVDVVSEGRNMDPEKVKTLADGRVYTGRQALEHGLIDHVGYFDDVVALVKEETGLTNLKIIKYRKKVGLSELLLSVAAGGARPMTMFDMTADALTSRQAPSFLYLWAPGKGEHR